MDFFRHRIRRCEASGIRVDPGRFYCIAFYNFISLPGNALLPPRINPKPTRVTPLQPVPPGISSVSWPFYFTCVRDYHYGTAIITK